MNKLWNLRIFAYSRMVIFNSVEVYFHIWRYHPECKKTLYLKRVNHLIFFVFIFFILIAHACVNTPKQYRESGLNPIRSAIHRAIDKSGLSTNLGIKIVSLMNNQVFYELNAGSLFNPASNNKLYTCISALALLDTGFTFTTSVFKINNSIYLVGGGDPDLSLKSLDSLAKVTAESLDKIDTLYIDDFLFDSIRFGEGWMWDEGPWKYAAQISALSVNDNCVDFYINPGKINRPVQYILNPESEYVQITNLSETVNDTAGFEPFKIDRNWANRINHFTLSGMIMNTAAADTFSRNIEDPPLFAGNIFKEMLLKHGVNTQTIAKKKFSGRGHLITFHTSKSLIFSLENLMKESDNLTAELLVKMIGHQTSGTIGTWKNGLTAIKLFLKNEVGMDTTSFYLADGSGVSRYNYSSPEHFIQLLSWAYRNDHIRENFISTLPIGGWDGTLKHRMNGQFGSRIFAKTGTLAGVSCLSGYVFTKTGEPFAFSIMMNGYVQSSKPYRDLQDKITEILSEL